MTKEDRVAMVADLVDRLGGIGAAARAIDVDETTIRRWVRGTQSAPTMAIMAMRWALSRHQWGVI